MTDIMDSRWTSWLSNSTKAPVDNGTLVDVKFRNGEVFYNQPVNEVSGNNVAHYAFWKTDGASNDIVAYRLSKPPHEERAAPITLRPGDYVSTEGMTEDDYHAVAAAFMTAGADKHEYPDIKCFKSDVMQAFGWVVGGGLFHGRFDGSFDGGRRLTPAQVLSATNAGRNTETQQEPTAMHLTDLLYQARKERDEAQARYEQVLADHRATYPFLVVEENAQPAEDMSDPANWKVGDILECTQLGGYFTKGKEYEILDPQDPDEDDFYLIDDDGDRHAWDFTPAGDNFRFVRRP